MMSMTGLPTAVHGLKSRLTAFGVTLALGFTRTVANKSGSPTRPGISGTFRGDSTKSLLMVRLPQFDFVAVGIVYPREAAVAFVLAPRVDLDAFFR